jgi:hypothetical protein
MANKRLIKRVFSIIGEKLAEQENTNIILQVCGFEEGINLLLRYNSDEDRKLIYDIRSECISKGIWFDSGAFLDENAIEWNLDCSLKKVKNEKISK